MEWLDTDKEIKIIIRCYIILRILILVALIIITIEFNEIVDLLKHILYHTYNCCGFQ